MGDEPLIRLEPFFGRIEVVPTQRFDNGAMILGGYAIHYDMHGKELYRTPDEPTVRVIWD